MKYAVFSDAGKPTPAHIQRRLGIEPFDRQTCIDCCLMPASRYYESGQADILPAHGLRQHEQDSH